MNLTNYNKKRIHEVGILALRDDRHGCLCDAATN